MGKPTATSAVSLSIVNNIIAMANPTFWFAHSIQTVMAWLFGNWQIKYDNINDIAHDAKFNMIPPKNISNGNWYAGTDETNVFSYAPNNNVINIANPPTIINIFLTFHLIKYLEIVEYDDDEDKGVDGDESLLSFKLGSFEDDGDWADGDDEEDEAVEVVEVVDIGLVLCAMIKPNITPQINDDTEIANEA